MYRTVYVTRLPGFSGGWEVKMLGDYLVSRPDYGINAAAVLSDMDADLSALESRRDKTCALKQAMMQELLTGRTRLV